MPRAEGADTLRHPSVDKQLYAIRYRIDCFFHRIKRCRRLATRFEKTGGNYLALVHLASSLVWLRAL